VKIPVPDEGIETLFGSRDENLKQLEQQFDVQIRTGGNELLVTGDAAGMAKTERVIGQLTGLLREGYRFSREDVRRASEMVSEDAQIDLRDFFLKAPLRASSTRQVTPKTLGQRRYLDAIERHDVVFGIGPAGTGKTYLAVAYAISALLAKDVRRIVLARPAVEAGERLGFLPGTLQQKVDPYLRPLYDALHDLLEAERVERNLASGIIEVAPLAFMRGRSLNESFIILDEAQNATAEQMKMFITRLGFGSKAAITGDITQIDLPPGKRSGLIEAIDVLADVKGVRFVHFDEQDVVRHGLVQRIIRAYDRYGSKRWHSAAAARDQAAEYVPGHDRD
jgi:phosphate starvation-inducible PhoH-like protein